MASVTTDAFPIDMRIQNDEYTYTFRPELYTVAAGSYISDSSFGASAALVNTYKNLQLNGETTIPLTGTTNVSASTFGRVRQRDNQVDFDINITLNANVVDPAYTTQELRIKVLDPLSNEPQKYKRGLPEPDINHFLPEFLDVEITNKSNIQIAPTIAQPPQDVILCGRLLDTGVLALTVKSMASPPTSAGLTHAQLSAIWSAVGTQVIFIRVHGSYRALSHP